MQSGIVCTRKTDVCVEKTYQNINNEENSCYELKTESWYSGCYRNGWTEIYFSP